MADVFIWRAFWRLSNARRWIEGLPLGLSFVEINAFCEFHGMDEYQERVEFDYMLDAMDKAWREEVG